MTAEQRRSSRRSLRKAPIRYLHAEMDQYHDGFMYNYCEAGLYFELFEPLNYDDRLHVIIPDHRTGAAGPAGFPYYLSQVCWCRELEGLQKPRYGVGVAILEKSYDLQWLPNEPQYRECDICGRKSTGGTRLPYRRHDLSVPGLLLFLGRNARGNHQGTDQTLPGRQRLIRIRNDVAHQRRPTQGACFFTRRFFASFRVRPFPARKPARILSALRQTIKSLSWSGGISSV